MKIKSVFKKIIVLTLTVLLSFLAVSAQNTAIGNGNTASTAEGGAVDVGVVKDETADVGAVKDGAVDSRTADGRTVDVEAVKDGTVDVGIVKDGAVDSRTADSRTVDVGAVKDGTVDVGAVDGEETDGEITYSDEPLIQEHPQKPSETESLPDEHPHKGAKIIDVPFISQRPAYPNGCEAVSTVMLLQYLGIDISCNDFIYKHLERGLSPYIQYGKWYACNPREQYPGDPANATGWGCYPEVIKKAIDSLAPEGFCAYTLKDVPLSTLCSEYIDNDIPVVFWGTIDMKKPTEHVTWSIPDSDKTHTWINPFHCLLLVGYDSEGYYFNDPWRTKERFYPRDAVELAYSGIGYEALVVLESKAKEAFEEKNTDVGHFASITAEKPPYLPSGLQSYYSIYEKGYYYHEKYYKKNPYLFPIQKDAEK